MTAPDEELFASAHVPAIWGALRNELRDKFSHNGDISFQFTCRWEDLQKLDDEDAFRHRLAESDAYAAFLIRALIGTPKGCDELSCVTVNADNNGTNISIPAKFVPHLLRNTTDQDFIGADLVARVALGVAYSICRTTGCNFTPRLDCYRPANDQKRRDLRFWSADFVVANVKDTPKIDSILEEGPCCPNHYHHFGWVGGKPPKDWENHGWQMESERFFTNNPNVEKKDNEIETLLSFPAFFKHDEDNIIISLPLSDPLPTINCRSHETLLAQGIKPYLDLKQKEYDKRKSEYSKGCILLCLGVSNQRAAYFDPERFNWAYGVFLTVDLECDGCNLCGEGGNVDAPDCKAQEFLRRIVQDLKGMRYQIKYKTLQVLTGRLLNDLDEQNRKLQKSALMLQQLTRPLQSLSDALGTTQAEVQEIRAILYEPMEAIFALQSRIAQFFEQNRMIENPDGSRTRISHQPDGYRDEGRPDDARWVLAHVLATFRGKKVFLASSEEALGHELFLSSKASKDKTSSFRQLAVTTLRLIDYDPSRLLDAVEALNCVKWRLFLPFKPDEALTAIKGGAIAALLPVEAKITCEDNFPKKLAIPRNINPFATQGHLLRFISGVVSATFNAPTDGCKQFTITTDGNGLTIKCSDNHPWVNTLNISQLFKVLLREIRTFKDGSRPLEENWGDRADPFVRLLRKLPPEYRSLDLIPDKSADEVAKIELNGKVVLERTNAGVVIKIDQLTIRYDTEFYVGKNK